LINKLSYYTFCKKCTQRPRKMVTTAMHGQFVINISNLAFYTKSFRLSVCHVHRLLCVKKNKKTNNNIENVHGGLMWTVPFIRIVRTHQVLGWTLHLPPAAGAAPSQPWKTSVAGGHPDLSPCSHHTQGGEIHTVHRRSPLMHATYSTMQQCRGSCKESLSCIKQGVKFFTSSKKGHTLCQ